MPPEVVRVRSYRHNANRRRPFPVYRRSSRRVCGQFGGIPVIRSASMKRMGWKAGYAKACRAYRCLLHIERTRAICSSDKSLKSRPCIARGEHVKAAYEAPIARADLARPAVLRLGLHGRS